MSSRTYSGLFIAEGSSDQPLAEHIQLLFYERGVELMLSSPEFERLSSKVTKDVESRIAAGLALNHDPVDLIVVHRDADNAGYQTRLHEITTAYAATPSQAALIPVIPVRMTEAWLLLDETAIRQVAGNPRGRTNLGLPKVHEVESISDPKARLADCILRAADETGRRRDVVKARFNEHRRQLLDRLEPSGPLGRLESWKRLTHAVDQVVKGWK
ncbi:DUF4276 family protein [Micromonospora echinospora]|uniref:DUF4276 family protein n=1 Tax=Micromonospora echinospora TaxID=1877 RepID=A0ABR6MJ42_MICEC|nr:DUF4276 family protein [Micromonospora echinospora]MBB5115391.1 hypothetical protein [Micromonospora echinospora]